MQALLPGALLVLLLLAAPALPRSLPRVLPLPLRPPASAAPVEMPAEVTADVAATERASLYASRACLFVTTRILVVDLLSGRVSADQIAGLLVLNAHR